MSDPTQQSRDRATALAEQLRAGIERQEGRETFDRARDELCRLIALRENSKTQQDLPLPLLNQLIHEANTRLSARNILKYGDVRLLTFAELQATLRGKGPSAALLSHRTDLLAWKAKRSWLPVGFWGDECKPTDKILFGVSGSPGVVEGPARVVNGPAEFGSVRPGDVVVARSTNPLWTQLFGRIAGIVVENGSRISHAAVVAREAGIPAVVGIPGLVAAITQGERLRVDGLAGEVHRLDLS